MSDVAPAKITKADWLDQPATQAVFDAIEAGNHSVRAVGGTVRNALLDHPVQDLDLATTASPSEVIRLVQAAGLKAVATGIDHGTVTVISENVPFEVTTLRRDVETFGRHAQVVFTTDWQADAARRDFTMNALYCDRDGTIFDPLGGYRDVMAGRVCFIGSADDRIKEDYLRILRFFRFSAVYTEGPLDRVALAACTRGRAGLAALSGERVRTELLRLLSAPRAMDAVWAMFDYGLLVDVIGAAPDLVRLKHLIDLEAEHDFAPDPVRRLGALSIRVSEDVQRLATRLRLSNDEQERLAALVVEHPQPSTPRNTAEAKILIYRIGGETFLDRLLMASATNTLKPHDETWNALVRLSENWMPPQLPIAGGDLLDLGMPSGPAIGELLHTLEEIWLAQGFKPSRADLLEHARTNLAGQTPKRWIDGQ